MSEKEIKNQNVTEASEKIEEPKETETTVVIKDSFGVKVCKWVKKHILENPIVDFVAGAAVGALVKVGLDKVVSNPKYQLLDESTEEKLVEGIEPTEE